MSISFYDTQTGALLAENTGQQTGTVTSVGWTYAQGTVPLAISAGTDTRATVWNGQSHQLQTVFLRHTSAIEALAVLATTVATASSGGVIRVWSATSGQEVHGSYANSAHAFRSIAFSALGTLAAGSDDGIVHLWHNGLLCTRQIQGTFDLTCIENTVHLQGHASPVRALAFSPDGMFLATGGDDRRFIIWSVQHQTPVYHLPQPEKLTALSWSPSGRFLAGACGPAVVIWQMHL